MKRKKNKEIPGYIMEFIEAIYPGAPHLALLWFNEEICLKDATKLINELRKELASLKGA